MMTIVLQALFFVFIEMSCANIFFRTFMRLRFPEKPWLSGLTIFILTILLSAVAIIMTDFHVARAITVMIVLAIAMYILYSGKVKQIIFFTICFYSIILAIDLGLMTIISHIFQEQFEQILYDPVAGTVLITFLKAILLLFVVFIRWKFLKMQFDKLPESYEWIIFIFTPIMTVVIMLFFFIDGYNSERVLLIVSFGLLTVSLFLFHLLQKFVLRAKGNQEAKLIDERTKNQLEFYESIAMTYQEQRTREHEFKNHIDCIQGLLSANDNEEALEYVQKISGKIQKYLNPYDTGNSIINAVVNQKYRQGKKEGIVFMFALDELSEINIADDDLVVLLSNLLNNALEACQQLVNAEKVIYFRFQPKEEHIIIATKNPVESPVEITEEGLVSTKENPDKHGIGLSNIKKVVDKYGGDHMYSCREGFFYHTIIFKRE